MTDDPLPAQKALRRLVILGVVVMVVCIAILAFAWSNTRKSHELLKMADRARVAPSATKDDISVARFGTEAQTAPAWEIYTPPDAAAALDAAKSLVDNFWETGTWQKKLKMVRKPERVEPLMRDFYEKRHRQDRRGVELRSHRFQRAGAVEVLNMTFSNEAGSADPPVIVNLVRDPDGKWLLDWESSVGSGDGIKLE